VTCSQGQCVVACNAGLSACAGRCVDTLTEHDHCGACGRACAATESCVAGLCVPPVPPPPPPQAGTGG
jgi:hypothetical protein